MSIKTKTYIIDRGTYSQDSSGINWVYCRNFVLTSGFEMTDSNYVSEAAAGLGALFG